MKQLAMSIASIGLALSVHAADGQTQSVEKIQVTGSNIKRINKEAAVPVQVLTKEDIDRSGATTLKQFLETQSAATGGLNDITSGNRFSPGASATSLRNLGAQSTLVLLNNRRVATYGLPDYATTFTNLDSLPLAAIERIEILKSGASAIYGSDAVAGVVNVITRKDYQGLLVRAGYGDSTENSLFTTTSASITGGIGNLATDRFNVMISADAFHRKGFSWREGLPYIHEDAGKWNSTLASYDTQLSSFSWPGNVIGVGPVNGGQGCAKVVNNLCMYDRFERFQAVPESRRANLSVVGNVDISDSMQLTADFTYSKTETDFYSAFATWGTGVTNWPSTEFGKFQNMNQTTQLPSVHPLNKTAVNRSFRYRFVDSNAASNVEAEQYRFVTALKGEAGGYDWEVGAGVMESEVVNSQRGNFSVAGFRKHIGDWDRPYNPTTGAGDKDFFNRTYKIGQKNSADVINELFPEYVDSGTAKQSFIDAKISGALMEMSAGTLSFAAGAEFWHDSQKTRVSANLARFDIVGRATSTADSSRNYSSLFSELNVPLLKNLEAQVAARVDKFPNLDAHISPKVALRYEAAAGVLFRGSVETGFRAPNLSESATSVKTSFQTVSDPARCLAATRLSNDLKAQAAALPAGDPNKTLLAARADIVGGNECRAGALANVVNNPNLKPEESKSFSLGMVLEPVRGFSFSADYWRIERKNEIRTDSITDLLNREASLPAGKIVRKAVVVDANGRTDDRTFETKAEMDKYGVKVGQIGVVNNSFLNYSKTKTDGIDFNITGKYNAGEWGRINTDFNMTYLRMYKNFSDGLNDWGWNLAGTYGTPRIVSDLSVAWKKGAYSNTFRTTLTSKTKLSGDYDDPSFTIQECDDRGIEASACRNASFARVDYLFEYTGIKNLKASLFIKNLFDRKYFDHRAWGTPTGVIPPTGELANAEGRAYRIGLEYKFF